MYILKRRREKNPAFEYHESRHSLLPIWIYWPRNTVRIMWVAVKENILHIGKTHDQGWVKYLGYFTASLFVLLGLLQPSRIFNLIVDHGLMLFFVFAFWAVLFGFVTSGRKPRRQGGSQRPDRKTVIYRREE